MDKLINITKNDLIHLITESFIIKRNWYTVRFDKFFIINNKKISVNYSILDNLDDYELIRFYEYLFYCRNKNVN